MANQQGIGRQMENCATVQENNVYSVKPILNVIQILFFVSIVPVDLCPFH